MFTFLLGLALFFALQTTINHDRLYRQVTIEFDYEGIENFLTASYERLQAFRAEAKTEAEALPEVEE